MLSSFRVPWVGLEDGETGSILRDLGDYLYEYRVYETLR
jgi:hypothetical protein